MACRCAWAICLWRWRLAGRILLTEFTWRSPNGGLKRENHNAAVAATGSDHPRKRPHGDHVAAGGEHGIVVHGDARRIIDDGRKPERAFENVAGSGICGGDKIVSGPQAADDVLADEERPKRIYDLH